MNIIFDLDGTLVDSAVDIHTAVNLALADAGYPALSESQVRSFIGEGAQTLMTRALAAVGATQDLLPQAHKGFLRHYDGVMLDKTRPYPGVLPALEALKARGFHLAVCTNKPEAPARAILEATGLAALMQAVVGGDTLPRRKPDPAPVLHTNTLLGGGTAFFVGDSEIDAAAAQAAGLPFFLFTPGYRKVPVEQLPHHAAFAHYAELPGLIGA